MNSNHAFEGLLGVRTFKYGPNVCASVTQSISLVDKPRLNPLFIKYRMLGRGWRYPLPPKGSPISAGKFGICDRYFTCHNDYFADPNEVHRRCFNRLIQGWLEQYGQLDFNDLESLNSIVEAQNRHRTTVKPLQLIAIKLCQQHFDSISGLSLTGFDRPHLEFLKRFLKWSQVPQNNIAVGLRLINSRS